MTFEDELIAVVGVPADRSVLNQIRTFRDQMGAGNVLGLARAGAETIQGIKPGDRWQSFFNSINAVRRGAHWD